MDRGRHQRDCQPDQQCILQVVAHEDARLPMSGSRATRSRGRFARARLRPPTDHTQTSPASKRSTSVTSIGSQCTGLCRCRSWLMRTASLAPIATACCASTSRCRPPPAAEDDTRVDALKHEAEEAQNRVAEAEKKLVEYRTQAAAALEALRNEKRAALRALQSHRHALTLA